MKVKGTFEIDESFYNTTLVARYAKELSEKEKARYDRQFGLYQKEMISLEEMPKLFMDAKEKIKSAQAGKK